MFRDAEILINSNHLIKKDVYVLDLLVVKLLNCASREQNNASKAVCS